MATGLCKEYLKNLGKISVSYPKDFNIHPRIKKFHIDDRLKKIE